jgi:predicted RNase H-like HicB family nuclease
LSRKNPETDLYVGWIPGLRGAHSQGETLDELNDNLREVVEMLLEDGEPHQIPDEISVSIDDFLAHR